MAASQHPARTRDSCRDPQHLQLTLAVGAGLPGLVQPHQFGPQLVEHAHQLLPGCQAQLHTQHLFRASIFWPAPWQFPLLAPRGEACRLEVWKLDACKLRNSWLLGLLFLGRLLLGVLAPHRGLRLRVASASPGYAPRAPSAGTRSGAAYVAGTSPPPPALRLVTGNASAVPSAVAGAQHQTLVS